MINALPDSRPASEMVQVLLIDAHRTSLDPAWVLGLLFGCKCVDNCSVPNPATVPPAMEPINAPTGPPRQNPGRTRKIIHYCVMLRCDMLLCALLFCHFMSCHVVSCHVMLYYTYVHINMKYFEFRSVEKRASWIRKHSR